MLKSIGLPEDADSVFIRLVASEAAGRGADRTLQIFEDRGDMRENRADDLLGICGWTASGKALRGLWPSAVWMGCSHLRSLRLRDPGQGNALLVRLLAEAEQDKSRNWSREQWCRARSGAGLDHSR